MRPLPKNSLIQPPKRNLFFLFLRDPLGMSRLVESIRLMSFSVLSLFPSFLATTLAWAHLATRCCVPRQGMADAISRLSWPKNKRWKYEHVQNQEACISILHGVLELRKIYDLYKGLVWAEIFQKYFLSNHDEVSPDIYIKSLSRINLACNPRGQLAAPTMGRPKNASEPSMKPYDV